jgi:hypothetical protein
MNEYHYPVYKTFWYVVKNIHDYKIDDIIPDDLIKKLIKNPKSLSEFRLLEPYDIYRFNSNYTPYTWQTSNHFDTLPSEIFIEKLLNNKENLDEFYSNFLSKSEKYHCFQKPFDIIGVEVNLVDIIVGIIGPGLIQKKIDVHNIKFPQNITEVYWYMTGIPDEKPWYALLKIKYKDNYVYGFFRAECAYTGFDADGTVQLYLSDNIYDLLIYSIDAKIYRIIEKNILTKKYFS